MKTKYSLYLKSVFLSSIAALINTKSNATTYDLNKLETGNKTTRISTTVKTKMLTPKLRLKFNEDNSYLAMAHRSHSSHRSHASHRSHYSGYSTGGTVTTPGTTETNVTIQTNDKKGSSKKQKKVAPRKLGDRILTMGMKGTDVKQLIKILSRKGYYKISYLDMPDTNVFTIEVEQSVKNFQKADSLKPDGIVGPNTVLYLKK